MNGNEIFTRRNEIEHELHTLVNSFILTGRIKELEKELDELQSKCDHCYGNGYCVYCGKEEES